MEHNAFHMVKVWSIAFIGPPETCFTHFLTCSSLKYRQTEDIEQINLTGTGKLDRDSSGYRACTAVIGAEPRGTSSDLDPLWSLIHCQVSRPCYQLCIVLEVPTECFFSLIKQTFPCLFADTLIAR